MKSIEQQALRRRHWLALCISSLVTACGGGSGDGAWDTNAGIWDNMTWQ